jgi:hypothetical protein
MRCTTTNGVIGVLARMVHSCVYVLFIDVSIASSLHGLGKQRLLLAIRRSNCHALSHNTFPGGDPSPRTPEGSLCLLQLAPASHSSIDFLIFFKVLKKVKENEKINCTVRKKLIDFSVLENY